jgi:hypothetical protein
MSFVDLNPGESRGAFSCAVRGLTKFAVLNDKGLWRASPKINYSQLPCPCAHVILRSCVCEVTAPAMFPSSRGLSCGQVFDSIELTEGVSWPLDAVRMRILDADGREVHERVRAPIGRGVHHRAKDRGAFLI